MPNDRTPRSMREAFGDGAALDMDDLPREPLTRGEALLLVLVWVLSAGAVAGFCGYLWARFTT